MGKKSRIKSQKRASGSKKSKSKRNDIDDCDECCMGPYCAKLKFPAEVEKMRKSEETSEFDVQEQAKDFEPCLNPNNLTKLLPGYDPNCFRDTMHFEAFTIFTEEFKKNHFDPVNETIFEVMNKRLRDALAVNPNWFIGYTELIELLLTQVLFVGEEAEDFCSEGYTEILNECITLIKYVVIKYIDKLSSTKKKH